MKIAVVSGGFDPVHSGHLEYINSAAMLGDKLVVCLNSDAWLIRKKGRFFLPFHERKIILENIKAVDHVISFDDDESGSASNGLIKTKEMFPGRKIIFCNGGDRTEQNIPEMKVSEVDFYFGTGGDEKKNSSSWILKEWASPSTNRRWGKFFDLFQDNFVRVKELVVKPNQGMSFQRHFKRSESWLISAGKCDVNYSESDPSILKKIILEQGDRFDVSVNEWHQITNPYPEECRIIEIQYGKETDDKDIERLYYYKD
ncbi:adenylyltransferase/cytidyltransferase family protein [Gammaproteobacteria bacterium]|nr:adenylyltransferase/cytidyltransferase family protein [Gammaproteobacteria bacterium]